MSSFSEVWSNGPVARNPRRPGPAPASLASAPARGSKAKKASPSPFPPTNPSLSPSPPPPQGQQRRPHYAVVASPRAGHRGFVKAMAARAGSTQKAPPPPPPRPVARVKRAPPVAASPRGGVVAAAAAAAGFGDTAEEEDVPPAGLPTLHQSSSGSEDEGFGGHGGFGVNGGLGGDGHEAMLRKFSTHVLTSAPLVPRAPRGAGARAATVDARSRWMAVLPSAPPPPLPARKPPMTIPRATPVASAVNPSTVPPPPLPPRIPATETSAAGGAAPAPPVLKPRPLSLPLGAAGYGKAKAASKRQEEEEGRKFFRDQRLETTLVRAVRADAGRGGRVAGVGVTHFFFCR